MASSLQSIPPEGTMASVHRPGFFFRSPPKTAWLVAWCLAITCGPLPAEKQKGKSAPAAARPKTAASTAPAPAPLTSAPGFVYRAEKEGRVIFLAGGLHRLRRDAYPLPPAYETAYRQSGSLWLESNPSDADTNAGSTEAQKKGLMAGWKNVNDLLTEPTRKVLKEHLTSRDIEPGVIKRMRPWYLGMYLMNLEYERLGVVMRYGVDDHFNQRAWLEDKPVHGLEKATDSVEALSKLSIAEQDRNLSDTLRHVANIPGFYSAITSAWRQGNEKAALELLRPKSVTISESWRSIVAARNASWLPKLEAMGTGRPAMVIVGLDHILGQEGLVQQLKARGYKVTAVSQ
jgi:uncharacterized protein YbaP (TraB family)